MLQVKNYKLISYTTINLGGVFPVKPKDIPEECSGCCYRRTCDYEFEKCCYLVRRNCLATQTPSFINVQK